MHYVKHVLAFSLLVTLLLACNEISSTPETNSYYLEAENGVLSPGEASADEINLQGTPKVLTDADASGGEAFLFLRTGDVLSWETPASGSFEIVVRAKAIPYEGDPELELEVGNQKVRRKVSDTEYADISFGTLDVKGASEVLLRFTNDHWRGSADRDRNVIVDYIQLSSSAETVTNTAPKLAPISTQTACVGTAFNLAITATDAEGDVLAYSAEGLPASMKLEPDGTAALLTGTPFEGNIGVFEPTITVTDSQGASDSLTFTFDLKPRASAPEACVASEDIPAEEVPAEDTPAEDTPGNGPPELQAVSAQSAKVGEAFSYTFSATDPDGDLLDFTTQGLPVTFELFPTGNNEARLVGTPVAADVGTFGASITALDPEGASATLSFTLTVSPAVEDTPGNDPPQLQDIPPLGAETDKAFSYAITADDPDGDTLTFSAEGLPTSIKLKSSGNNQVVLEGTPFTGNLGSFNPTITVTDSQGAKDSVSFILTIDLPRTDEGPVLEEPTGPESVMGTMAPKVKGSTQADLGYYEYLPASYDASRAEGYPVIVFFHGVGERGDGSSQLNDVLIHGPPRVISRGDWLEQTKQPFVVISPQTETGYPEPEVVRDFISFVVSDYNVDPNRVYLTGLSAGAISSWKYISKYQDQVAAVVAVAGRRDPTTDPCLFADIPIWAFHGDGDGVIPQSGSKDAVAEVNACQPAPDPKAKLTIFNGVGHDSWTRTYDSRYINSDGVDSAYDPFEECIYEWFLKYTR